MPVRGNGHCSISHGLQMICNFRFSGSRPLLGAFVVLLGAAMWYVPDIAAAPVCAPTSMIKVVTRQELPGVDTDAFLRAPKTLYRQGTQFGRLQEHLNPKTNIKLLIVVDEPNVWVANLEAGTGQYIRDPGPTFNFRAQVFGERGVQSEFVRDLEIGCEVSALRAAGAKESKMDHATLGPVTRLEHSVDSERLVLLVGSNGNPLRLELHKQDKHVYTLHYDEFQTGLKLDPALFTKPSGIAFDREPQPGK